jgi:Phosphotransferase enzyme family
MYRVIVLGRNGTEILVRRSDQGLHFPQVTIQRWHRVAEEVTAAMKKQWGEEIVCLFEVDLPPDGLGADRYIATRYWRNSGPSAAPLLWISVNDLGEDSFAAPCDYSALRNSLEQSSAAVQDAAAGPFARLTWFEELREWIAKAIAPRTLHLTGNFRQLNASPCFSLIRFETDGPAIWFKAAGEPNEREFPITLALARLFPDYTPEIVATRPEWNGWLTCEAERTNLDETIDPRCWETAAAALANLQIESIRSLPEVLDCGAHNLKLNRLQALVSPFMDVAAGLMREQCKTPPPVLSEVELDILSKRIQEAISVLEGLGVPDSLGHLDLNPANLNVDGERCVFLDWAEAYVGHPFFTFQYLLEHLRRTGTDSVSEQRLTSSYFAPWEQVASRDRIVEAAALEPLLAVFAYAAGARIWTQPEQLKEPIIAGYLRSLVRRMNRETHKLNERRSLCLS